MLEFLRQQLEQLRAKRAALKAELEGVLAAPKAEQRSPNETESARLTAGTAELRKLNEDEQSLLDSIAAAEETEKREQAGAAARAQAGQTGPRTGGAVVTREPLTYERGNGQSYFLDLARAQLRGDTEAAARLQRHGRELDVELPAREARRHQRAQEQADRLGLTPEQRGSMFEQRVNPNRTDGQGGYFVPPLWLVDQYIDLPRFGRTTANRCMNMELPAGTDSINLPKVATGTATGVQTADAAAVTSTDMTDTSVSAPVRTIAGQQDVAMQLLDQSPVAFDQIVFGDLTADYNMRLDLQVLNGSGSNGQHTGILNVGSINSVTYTDATPTLPEMYVPLAQGASLVAKNRKLPATAAVMLPSMWYWATSQLDTTNRPLLVPATVAYNPAASLDPLHGVNDDSPAGMLSIGLPAYLDGNLPTNLGVGTNETRIIVARWSDLYLWEGPLRTRVLQEVLSGTLQVRFQVYAYSAFMANRRPESISVLSGTGLVPAAGF